MLQNPCNTLGFKKNMVYKILPGGEVNHIQPVAYKTGITDMFNCNLHNSALQCQPTGNLNNKPNCSEIKITMLPNT